MEKPRFAIVGIVDNPNTQDLKKEIEDQGYTCDVLRISELIFASDGKGAFDAFCSGKNVCDFDIIFFRGYSKYLREAKILAELLQYHKKTVIEQVVGSGFFAGKIYEGSKLSRAQVSWLQTYQALNAQNWEAILEKMQFPIIVKPVDGSRGRDVMRFESKEEALQFLQEHPKGFLAQEYVDIDGDVRVFVVGGKIIGSMKRFVLDGDVRSNISLGAKAQPFALTPEMEKIAVDAAQAMNIEIAGVDLIHVQGKWKVLEVNHSPQWQGLKDATGINPTNAIVQYALEKYAQQA